jgi:DNA polymerase II
MIYYFDFKSLYPVMMMGGNLYSPAKPNEKYWQGSGVYPSHYINNYDGVKGKYSRKQGVIEKIIYDLLKKRTETKDAAQSLAIKIIINTMYGILPNGVFKSVYNRQAAEDCTAMARRSAHYARTVFAEHGYTVIYGDTDSMFVKDPFHDEKRILNLAKQISKTQMESMNIPCDFHDLKLECKIKRMYFFRDNDDHFIKKNYIYIQEDDKVKVKGLRIVKGNCSKLAVRVWEQTIKPMFINDNFSPFTFDTLLSEIKKVALEDPTLLEKRYRVKNVKTYKNDTGLSAQIAKAFGPGEKWLVINRRLGPGKQNHYATIEMLKNKYGESWIDMVRLESYLADLSEFIIVAERKNIKKTFTSTLNEDILIEESAI